MGHLKEELDIFRAAGTKIKSVSQERLAIGAKIVRTKNADSTSVNVKLKFSSRANYTEDALLSEEQKSFICLFKHDQYIRQQFVFKAVSKCPAWSETSLRCRPGCLLVISPTVWQAAGGHRGGLGVGWGEQRCFCSCS